jgi:hypothetical protein
MGKHGITAVTWKKATRSNGNGGNNCVEVAFLDGGYVAVGDSKKVTSPALIFTSAEWEAFVESAKDGEFDLK